MLQKQICVISVHKKQHLALCYLENSTQDARRKAFPLKKKKKISLSPPPCSTFRAYSQKHLKNNSIKQGPAHISQPLPVCETSQGLLLRNFHLYYSRKIDPEFLLTCKKYPRIFFKEGPEDSAKDQRGSEPSQDWNATRLDKGGVLNKNTQHLIT